VSLANLLNRIKSGLVDEPEPQRRHEPLRLATAAVLLEIAHADGEFTPAEDEDIATFLARRFQLTSDDTRELMEAATELRARTIDYFALTNYIRKNASLDERIEIVKTMWRMAYSDGKLTDYEGYLVRKLADLLGLEHRVMIEAKTAVLEERRRG